MNAMLCDKCATRIQHGFVLDCIEGRGLLATPDVEGPWHFCGVGCLAAWSSNFAETLAPPPPPPNHPRPIRGRRK